MNKPRTKKQEEFLLYFNELHKFLQIELKEEFLKTERGRNKNAAHDISFSDCLQTIKERYKNTTLSKYKDQLYLINNFRNISVHDYTNTFHDIADPSVHTMEVMQNVYNYFVRPTTIKKYLNDEKNLNPIILNPETCLSEMLKLVSNYKISQFPIFHNEELRGMITDNGVTNFIANKNDAGGIIFEEETVADVIENENDMEEHKNSFAVLYIEDELYRVRDLFSNIESMTKYVLVSKSGNREFRTQEDLIGIFTVADIPEIIHYLAEN